MALKVYRSGGPVPPRILIHGGQKVGKTTFAAGAPNPIFLPTEDGLAAIPGVDRFPLLRSYEQIDEALDQLLAGMAKEDGTPYGTAVLDSADWAEPLILDKVARDHGMAVYDTTMKGSPLAFGRGPMAAANVWGKLLAKFDRLRDERGMATIIIAHSKIKRSEDAFVDAYDKYVIDLLKDSTAKIVEWADIIGYATQKVSVRVEKIGQDTIKKHGLMTEPEHVLFTKNRPECISGSRWPLPAEMPLNYPVFHDHLMKAMLQPAQQNAA